MGREEFKKYLAEVADKFREIDKPVKLVSNLDADGISACSVMKKALERLNLKHSVRIVHQLREQELIELSEEDYEYYIFTDVGSGVLNLIDRILKDKRVLVLDHHNPHGSASNVWHCNPHDFDVNGSAEVSASGVSFLFAHTLDEANADMAHIAIVGAIGDVQEDDGFTGLNQEILETGLEAGVIEVERGLNLYGKEGRPLHKLLEYSSDLNIPGVTNSESGAIQFLNDLDIDPMKDGQWKFFSDLTEEEKKKLASGIIMKRNDTENPEDIFTQVYTIPGEEGVFRNAKEFSTLLNACGRLDKASIGVGACLGKPEFKRKALEVQKEYKSEIVDAIKWYENNEDTSHVKKGEGYVIINAREEIRDTIIGTLISIISKSWDLPSGTVMLSMARKPNNVTKISIRVVDNPEGMHLREILTDIVAEVDGECGGHQYAAGGLIKTEKEKEFITAAENKLKELNI